MAVVSGCAASLPRVAPATEESDGQREPVAGVVAPAASDGKRQLPPAQAAALVERLQRASSSELLARHLSFVEKHVERPLLVGNRSRLLIDGPETHAAMFKAIASARHSIDLETYILESGDVGDKLAALLTERRRQGVRVRLLYDALGALTTPKAYFQNLAEQGVGTCAFNPLRGNASTPELTVNNRDHRKILVVDQRVAFTGGINISGVYSKGSFSRGGSHHAESSMGWRDTHIQLEGPVVAEFSRLFQEAWQSQACGGGGEARAIDVAQVKAPPARAGEEVMRVIAQDPLAKRNEVYVEMLSALGHAEQRAWLTFGYFVPDPQTLSALSAAARRGVDVRLMVPSKSDVWLTLYAGRSHYTELLENGVRIYERRAAVLHAKTAVVDGVWATVGTSNLDWRSFVHNFEVNVVVLGTSLADELERLFRRDMEHADEITLEAWRNRGLATRVKETFSRLWAYYL